MAASEPTTGSLAASLTRELLHELIADIAIQEYEFCQFRKGRLNQLYYEQAQNGLLAVNGTGNGTNGTTSPNKKERDEGLFGCVVCNRQIAAPRYASHLSGCMGLSGSRRGERRAAANAAVNGKPTRNGSAASSYGSDTDTEKKNGANGLKRSASTTSTSSQNKKSKPTPLPSTPSSSQTFQPPHIGSHPLSKTMSLPASPVGSPTATPHAIPPRPSSVAPGAVPPSQQPQRNVPSKTPAIVSQPNARPTHPLAQAQRPPPPPPQQPSRPTTASTVRNDDRPDSDSEDSDSDLEIQEPTTSRPPNPQTSSKTPRVPPPSQAMQRNGSTNASQKQPRKTNGSAGVQQGVGRKATRPVARVNHDSASSDEDASDGSGSD